MYLKYTKTKYLKLTYTYVSELINSNMILVSKFEVPIDIKHIILC